MSTSRRSASVPQSDTLADILERVLETGIVVAGDIRVKLNDVELLTIQIRLVVCSVDKAQEMGMDWWKGADFLSSSSSHRLDAPDADDTATSDALAKQLEALNARLDRLEGRLVDRGEDDSEGRTET